MFLQKIDNKWFFTELPWYLKMFLFFIKGDLIILLPLLLSILFLGFFSVKFMLLMLGLYIAVRFFGEMIYWFSHQFGERKYRPFDFRMTKLDNHAVYILHQTFSIVGVVLGVGVMMYSLLYL